jgi:hypothetical protein
LLAAILFITAAVLFKTDFLMELGISLLFPEGKRRYKQDFPPNNVNFKLKSGFIHLIPTFNGLASEDPHTHLKEFHMVCFGMKPNGVDEVESFPFLFKRGSKGMVFLYSPRFHWNVERHEEDFP